MVAYEPTQDGPYPEPPDLPDGPGQMQAIVAWAAARSAMRFANEAQRTSKLPNPTDGMLSYLASNRTLYIYESNTTRKWIPIYEQTISATLQALGGGVTGSVQVSRVNGTIHFTGTLAGLPTAYPRVVLNLPVEYRPRGSLKAIVGGSGTTNEAMRLISIDSSTGDVTWINNSGLPGSPSTGTSLWLTGLSYYGNILS